MIIESVNPSWWVRRWAELYPEKTAIVYEDTEITYRDLWNRVERTAAWMQSIGIESGDRVAVILENRPALVDVYLASARLGAIFVPLNWRQTAEELDYLIEHCRPRLIVRGARFEKTLRGLDFASYRPTPVVACVGSSSPLPFELDFLQECSAFNGQHPFVTRTLGPSDPEDAQVIMYTSGTTGRPKGAVLSHRKTFFNCLNADIFLDLSFHDRMLVVLPMFHSGGLFIQTCPTLYKGGTVIIHNHFDPERVYRDIERYQVTKFLGVPTIFRSLIQVDQVQRGDVSSLRVCSIGGERVTHDIILQCWEAGFPFRQTMGQTETSILLWASEQELLNKVGTVGRPVFHAEVRLVDESGHEVGPNEVGEIQVRGSVVMNEYWQDPEQTEKAMVGGHLRTGDLARRDEDGYFFLVDRAKDMYISGGENVYPAEVERVLRAHPAIVDAAVVGIPDETWGEVGHAFIIPARSARLSEEDIIAWCRSKLAGYKCPRRISFRKEFPRTSLGKVRKFMLAGGPEE